MKRQTKYLIPANKKTKRSSHRLSSKQIDQLVSDYVGGEPAASVGRRFNCSIDNVRYHVKKRGLWPGGRRDKPLADRLWDRVDKSRGPRGCWIWTGAQFPNGYGCISHRGESLGVHRVAFELIRGPIPVTLTLDHKCENKICVNPRHLDPCTSGENTRRYLQRKLAKTF